MSATLEGMARAAYRAQYGAEFDGLQVGVRAQFMKVALLWLADNVSDEMIRAAYDADTERGNAKVYIAAAIRAASEGEAT